MTPEKNQRSHSMSVRSTRRDPSGWPSVLFTPECAGADALGDSPPNFFGDLNLDQIVASVTQAKTEYNLQPFFYSPLTSVAAVEYRQEVMRDFQNSAFKA